MVAATNTKTENRILMAKRKAKSVKMTSGRRSLVMKRPELLQQLSIDDYKKWLNQQG